MAYLDPFQGNTDAAKQLVSVPEGDERTPLDADAVAVDPQIPEEERLSLAVRPAGMLIPYRGTAPAPRPPESGSGCVLLAGALFAGALGGWAAGNPVLSYWLIALAGLSVLCGFAARDDERAVRLANTPITHHRRYVLPATDIDPVDRPLWDRAVDAANKITGSEVVAKELIDSVQVTTVLPQRLWEIADRLARLAEVRGRHREILNGVSPDDPDIAVVVGRQRNAQDLAAADVARRVAGLETVADLVARADTATKKETIVRELAELDGKHSDLLATIGETAAERDVTDRLANDATAVIEQAREAIKRANEAAISLAMPGDPERPDDASAGAAGLCRRRRRYSARRRDRSEPSVPCGSSSARSLRNSGNLGYISSSVAAETRESLAKYTRPPLATTRRSSSSSSGPRPGVRVGKSSARVHPGAGKDSRPGSPLPNLLSTVTNDGARCALTISNERRTAASAPNGMTYWYCRNPPGP